MIAGTLQVNIIANSSDLEASSKRSKASLADVTAESTRTKAALDAMGGSVTKHAAGLSTHAGLTARLTHELHGLTEEVAATAVAFLSLESAKRALESLVEAGSKLEESQLALEAFAGSARKGDEAFVLVRGQTVRLGFDLTTLTAAYKNLVGASRDSGLSASDTATMFTNLSTAAKGAGLNSAQAGELIGVFAGFLNRGEMTSRQLYQSLSLIPGAAQTLAKVLHVNVDELRSMGSEHLLIANITAPALARALGDQLGEAAEKAAGAIESSKNRMQSAWAELGKAITDGPAGRAIVWFLESQAKAFRMAGTPIPELAQTGNVIAEQAKASPTGQAFAEAVAQRNTTQGQLERARATLAEMTPGAASEMARGATEAQIAQLTPILEEQNRLVDEKYHLLIGLTTIMQAEATAARETAEATKASAEATKAQAGALDDARHTQEALATIAEQYLHIQERTAQALAANPANRLEIQQKAIQDLEKLQQRARDLEADAARRGLSTTSTAAGSSAVVQELQRRPNLSRQEYESIQRNAAASGVDPDFLAAVRMAQMGGPGKEFGVLSVPAPTYEDQARIAAQSIKASQRRYQAQGGVVTDASGRYTPEFIKFFSARYSPIGAENDPHNLNANDVPNLLKFYGMSAPGTAPAAATLATTGGASSIVQGMQGDIAARKLELDQFKIGEQAISQYLALQAAIVKQSMTPEEFDATMVERAHVALAQSAALKAAYTLDPQAVEASLKAASGALQTVLDAEFGALTMRTIREKLAREMDGLIAGMTDKAQALAHELPGNMATQFPEAAAQLGLRPSDVTANAGRFVPTERQAAISQAIPGYNAALAISAEEADRYAVAFKKLSDAQATKAGADYVQTLKDQNLALSTSVADTQALTLAKAGVSTADIQMAESLRQTNQQMQVVTSTVSGLTDEFVSMATSGTASLAQLGQALLKFALQAAMDLGDVKGVLSRGAIQLLGLGVSALGGGPGTSQGPVEGPIQQAAGGPTAGRTTYVIGEEGPELFLPRVGAPKMIGMAGPALWTAPSPGTILPLPRLRGMPHIPTQATYGGARAAGGPVGDNWAPAMPQRFYDTSSVGMAPASGPGNPGRSQGQPTQINTWNITTESPASFARSASEIQQRMYRAWQAAQRQM